MSQLVCDKCSSEIARSARFCANCGDPVTDADRPASAGDLSKESVMLVCPKCQKQNLQQLQLTSEAMAVTCPDCQADFRTEIAVVRAKRSSSSKKEGRRTFSVRVQNFNGSERLIEFVNSGTDDFELRSKDIAAFSYLNGTLGIVQNLKVRQYMKVSKPGCFVATYVYGADAPEVRHLREWRDACLLPSPVGAMAVSVYYHVSEPLVGWFGNVPMVRHVLRRLLAPIVAHARRTMSKRSP